MVSCLCLFRRRRKYWSYVIYVLISFLTNVDCYLIHQRYIGGVSEILIDQVSQKISNQQVSLKIPVCKVSLKKRRKKIIIFFVTPSLYYFCDTWSSIIFIHNSYTSLFVINFLESVVRHNLDCSFELFLGMYPEVQKGTTVQPTVV